ncbi:DUF3953 domain-containing protein [Peribacillus simplex]
MPYYMFFLGTFMLVTGLAELQKDRKGFWGYRDIVISLFIFFFYISNSYRTNRCFSSRSELSLKAAFSLCN